MSDVRPRHIAHRGGVEAAGFALDVRLLGEAETRRRVLAAWSPGVEVHRVGDLLVLRLPRPVHVEARSAPGTPLVETAGALLAAPLDAREVERLAPARGDVVIVRGGIATAVSLAPSSLIRPERWLDVGGYRVAKVVSLGAAPSAPHVVAEPEPFAARERLGGVAPAPDELARVVAALETRRAPATAGRGGSAQTGPSWGRASAGASMTRLARLLARLRSWLGRASANSGPAAPAPSGRREPGPLDRLGARLDRLGAWLLRTARLDALVGRRQAEYIVRMMEMLEGGDIVNGLRHAIPLGAFEGTGADRIAFGVPRPRADLRITPERGGAGSSIGLGADLMSELRQLYRSTFERLEAQGRLEEAAFVLAELLGANEEAVAFLERHGRLRLAAEMAEARELPPGLVVRQWFVAGDRHRAVAVARRTGAFADAVVRLERTDAKQAEVLRLLWAGSLADAGDYVKAVEVIWPVTSARRLATEWMDRAVDIGGEAGAKMLARRLAVDPRDEVRRRALELLDDETIEGAAARMTFGSTLANGERTPATTTVARAAARTILRDSPVAGGVIEVGVIYKMLVEMAGDGALRADTPTYPEKPADPLSAREAPAAFAVEAGDVGTLAMTDAVFLPNGRALVALGEAGARLVSREGRTVAEFAEPAHRLVVSDTGDRAIALAQRGDVWRLSRIDLRSRRAETWCEAKLDAWADDHDGSMWFVGAGEDFYAIDATARRFDALWRVPDVGGRTRAVARRGTLVTYLTEGKSFEEWRYDLPLLRLRSRTDVSLHPDGFEPGSSPGLAISPDGVVADTTRLFEAFDPTQPRKIPPPAATLRLASGGAVRHTIDLSQPSDAPGRPSITRDHAAAPMVTKSGARVLVVETATARALVEVELAGARDASVRLGEDFVTIVDDRGRLLVVELMAGRLVRNLRI